MNKKNQWTIDSNSDEISDATFEKVQIFVLPAPNAKFNEQEFDSLRKFINGGGSLLVLMGEDGENKLDTNINYLLEEFGIVCNSDSVIRSVYYKYFDPKEALIANGVLNRALGVAVGKQKKSIDDNNSQSLSFVYPYGATLSIGKQATALFSTGTVCYPISRPIAAFHQLSGQNGGKIAVIGSVHMFSDLYFDKEENSKIFVICYPISRPVAAFHQLSGQNGGKIAVIGSVHMFSDLYFDKEENSKIFDLLMRLLGEGLDLNPIDAAEPEINDARCIPDHIVMSNTLKSCLQESELEAGIGPDFMKAFDSSLYSLDLEMWPEVI
uniref:ABC-type uncharacterized transport system domain-containing protein n=1 Tax=Panagrolaimus sp. JU765 TaxID=591449 RepID=A0AC34RES2_9BILA